MTENQTVGEESTDEVVEATIVSDGVTDVALPDDPEQANELLMTLLSDERGAAQAILADLQRVAAEFENYRKRVQRDQTDIVDRAAERVVLELLPVLDSFDSAFTHESQSPAEEKLVAGMRSTYEQLIAVLAKEGLEAIPALGEDFDPNLHEAAQAPADAGAHLVVSEELRRGYLLRGRLIRPALVAVDHA